MNSSSTKRPKTCRARSTSRTSRRAPLRTSGGTSGTNLGAIVAQPDVATNAGSVTTVFPANSITLLGFPPARPPVPQPVVAAVTNAASANTIAPGEIVVVWGTNLGPATLTTLSGLDSNGMVSTSMAGVRILFDGVPAPLWYVSATQSAAAVPYFGASNSITHVQVEYQGVRSAPLAVPVSATAPGIFTFYANGASQGSILN